MYCHRPAINNVKRVVTADSGSRTRSFVIGRVDVLLMLNVLMRLSQRVTWVRFFFEIQFMLRAVPLFDCKIRQKLFKSLHQISEASVNYRLMRFTVMCILFGTLFFTILDILTQQKNTKSIKLHRDIVSTHFRDNSSFFWPLSKLSETAPINSASSKNHDPSTFFARQPIQSAINFSPRANTTKVNVKKLQNFPNNTNAQGDRHFTSTTTKIQLRFNSPPTSIILHLVAVLQTQSHETTYFNNNNAANEPKWLNIVDTQVKRRLIGLRTYPKDVSGAFKTTHFILPTTIALLNQRSDDETTVESNDTNKPGRDDRGVARVLYKWGRMIFKQYRVYQYDLGSQLSRRLGYKHYRAKWRYLIKRYYTPYRNMRIIKKSVNLIETVSNGLKNKLHEWYVTLTDENDQSDKDL